VTETAIQLRATSDALLSDLDALRVLEQEKRQIEPGDPRLVELATEIEEIAARVLGTTIRQRELSEQVDQLVDERSEDAPDQSIEDTPREIHAILADWRDAERRLADAVPGSPEARAMAADIERLREEYRRAHEAARSRAQTDRD